MVWHIKIGPKLSELQAKTSRATLFPKFFQKTWEGYFGPLKPIFFCFNGQKLFTMMDSNYFWGQTKNLGRPLHRYQIFAPLQNLILSLRGCFFRAICLFVYKNVVVVEKHSLRTMFSMCKHNSWLQNSRYRSLLFNFLRSLRWSILSARTTPTRPLITKTSRTSYHPLQSL